MSQTTFVSGTTITSTWLNDADGVAWYTAPYTGAVNGSGELKFAEKLSIFDFMTPAQVVDVQSGAGTLDVSAAIQAAFDAAISNSLVVRQVTGYGRARITQKITIRSGFTGEGPFDSSGGMTFLWYGSGATVFENTVPVSGLIFENFRVDMRNVITDTLGFNFAHGLVGSYWRNVRFYGWDDGNGFFAKTFKNQDGIKIIGATVGLTKADISLNTLERVYFGGIRRGFETTDPYNGASGGESTFKDCFGLCKEWVFRTTGRGNTWIGGDFAARSTFSVWKFTGGYASGSSIIGCSAEAQTAGDYAIICDADTAGTGGMGQIIGGKCYTGSWFSDLGVGTQLQRWIRSGDEDGLSSIDCKSTFLRGINALTTDVTKMGGVIGGGGKFMTLRGSSDAACGVLVLGSTTGSSSDPGGAAGASLIINDSNNSNFRLFKTSDGTTLTEFFRIRKDGFITNQATAPTALIDLVDSAAVDGTEIAIIGGSFTSTIKIQSTNTAGSAAYNAANTGIKVAKNVTTGRSVNAAGTLNAAGADYAEYECRRDDCGAVSKGQVIGFDAEGLLTDRWSLAIRFGIKSTNPSFVGGDAWGLEDNIGFEPKMPHKEDEESDLDFQSRVLKWDEDHENWHSRYEKERSKVERIAYSGKVPVNAYGAVPGEYLIAEAGDDDTITISYSDSPSFEEYRYAVGRVNRILDDGRAEVAVIIH